MEVQHYTKDGYNYINIRGFKLLKYKTYIDDYSAIRYMNDNVEVAKLLKIYNKYMFHTLDGYFTDDQLVCKLIYELKK